MHSLFPFYSSTEPIISVAWIELWIFPTDTTCIFQKSSTNHSILTGVLLLHSALPLCLRDFLPLQGTGVSQVSASGSLMYGTFWTVWERSTLLSCAVKQLTQLVVQAATEVNIMEFIHCYNHLVVSYHLCPRYNHPTKV